MKEKIKDKKGKSNIKINEQGTSDVTYINYYTFDIRYEILAPIIKDIQITSQLIKFIKKHQLSDLIFIKGNNSYSIESRFYFNYRNIIDFYIKVLDFIETDYFTKIKYYIYKTRPSSKDFLVNINLFYNDETSSKLSIEIILFNNATLNTKILNIIYNEFNLNITYLLQAIKTNKLQYFSFCSAIIRNEFFVLTQIIQNVKLIEYIINGQLKKIPTEEKKETSTNNNNINNEGNISNSEKDKSFIHVNEKYIVILKKKKDINDWLTVNNIVCKIQLIKIREDNMLIQYKVILNNKENENNDINSIYNLVTICIRKLTNNSSFIYIRYVWDFEMDKKLIISLKNLFKKSLHNIEKLSKTAKQY